MKEAVRQFRDATWAGWVALVLTVLAAVANVFKLILNSTYAYGYPDFGAMLVDPLTGFAAGVLVVGLCALLTRGILRRSVWAAVLAMTGMPYLYLVMLDGVAGAIMHQENYFIIHENFILVTQIIPSCFLVLLFGWEALDNYRRKWRRL